ncbi:MAG: tetratricopeptide repeat protein [Acidobacteriota bacterium]
MRGLLVVNLVGLIALAALFFTRGGGSLAADPQSAEHARQVASKLKSAGALDEAAELYEIYLETTDAPAETRASVAYSLGSTYLDSGRYESALRWFYEAESVGVGELQDQLAKKIVHTLERLGRYHSAKAVLDSRVALDPGDPAARSKDDPVVAKIGEEEVYRSQVLRLLDDLPPEAAAQFGPAQHGELLKKYVADELLWRKAVKLEYDKDPQVRRGYEALLKQMAISKMIEKDVVPNIRIDPADVKNFFEANRARYEKEGETLEQMPPEVERDYRMSKVQTAYQEMIESELATEDVDLFPERMSDG